MGQIYSLKVVPIKSTIYTVKRVLKNYTVIKFDGFLHMDRAWPVEALSGGTLACNCWSGKFKNNCRHRPLVILFDMEQRTNKGWFYDYDRQRWYLPVFFK